jgi:hypothetical protein
MISEKRVEANRENAQLSTGPKTHESKAVVARNAVKHGVFARIAESGEERDAYEQILAGLQESLNPFGQMEHLLVEKVAVDHLRLVRLIAYEAAAVRMDIRQLESDMEWSHGRSKPRFRDPDHRDSVPLELLSYSDPISEADVQAQKAILTRLSAPKHPLESDDRALEFIYRIKLEPQPVQSEPRQETPLPLDWRKKARAHYESMTPVHKGRWRAELLRREEQLLEEMKSVVHVREMVADHTPLHSLPPDEEMAKILKYETALQRSIAQNMDLLRKLQEPRLKRTA